MNQIRVNELISKYKTNSITKEEEKELDTLLISEWILDKKNKEINWDSIYYQRIHNKTKKSYLRQIISIAALIISILSITFLVNKYNKDVWSEAENTNLSLSEIKGAKDAAILTIGNGSKIQLEDKNYKEVIENLSEANDVEIYTISTPKASKYHLTLPDGTEVWLNANSQITFPSKFNKEIRKIETKGEVYLDVVKQKIPFIIHTNGITTEVLGTSFNINGFNPHKTITTLITGKVKISNNFSSKILSPGEAAEAATSNIKTLKPNIEKVISWKNNIFYFENESIEDILIELERWYDIEFVINADQLKSKTYSGIIDRSMTLQQTLDILNFGTSYAMKLTNKTITVTNKN